MNNIENIKKKFKGFFLIYPQNSTCPSAHDINNNNIKLNNNIYIQIDILKFFHGCPMAYWIAAGKVSSDLVGLVACRVSSYFHSSFL